MYRPSLVFVALLAVLTGCSADGTGPDPAPIGAVLLESAAAATVTVGGEGGSITTTSADGTVYTLEISAGSLPIESAITMTPIASIADYPLADGVSAGVDLAPSGLVFTIPAVLIIETAAVPTAGLSAIALSYQGDGESFTPALAGFASGVLTVPILHFSGATAGFATADELEELSASSAADCLIPAIARLAATPQDLPAAIAVYRSCFAGEVLPGLEDAATDADLAQAIGQFNMWKTVSRDAIGMPPFDDATETAQAMAALVPRLQEAILRNNELGSQQQSLAAVAKVLFWQGQAAHFDLDTVANLLDRDTVLSGLCVRAVVDAIQLPEDMQVGFPHSLDIRFGVIFTGQPASQGAPFAVEMSASGLDIQNPGGFTDAHGQYTTVITATQAGDLSVTARGCLVLPGTTTPTDVCVEVQSEASGEDLTGQWGGTAHDDEGASEEILLILVQNQNAVSGTANLCPPSTGVLGFSATLVGNELIGVSIDGVCNEDGDVCAPLRGTGTVNGDELVISASVSGDECDCGDIAVSISVSRGTDPCPPTEPR